MNFFWGNVFEYFKDRRLGAVFFGTLAAIFGLLLIGIIVCQATDGFDLGQYWPFALASHGLLLIALIWRGLRQMRARRSARFTSSPLSRDEKAKALSKLTVKSTIKIL
jgi:type VI protein secretion system component VasK